MTARRILLRLLFLAAFKVPLSASAQLYDHGDAPNSYHTSNAANGARHRLSADMRLGALVDPEADGVPSAGADSDDTTGPGPGDEDGVTFFAAPSEGAVPFQMGAWTQARVKVSLDGAFTNAGLDAWVDFNHDGDFLDTDEQIFSDKRLADIGNKNDGLGHTLGVFVPASALPGPTYARFRLSRAGGQSYDGVAMDGAVEDYGEVEDYAITITAPSLAGGVAAHVRDGQVWITWNYNTSTPAQVYEIYKSTSLFANVTNAQLVARLFPQEYAGANLVKELDTAFGDQTIVDPFGDTGGHENFVIPGPAGTPQLLTSGKGLTVETIRLDTASGPWYYAVVPRGRETIGLGEITLPAVSTPFNVATPPRMHVQQSAFIKDDGTAGTAANDYQVTFLNMWCDGDDAAGAGLGAAFPLMANSARRGVPHLCILMLPKGGLPAGGARPLSFVCPGGNDRATIWLPGRAAFENVGVAPVKGCVVALEDRVYQMLNGAPDGQNTNWLGYVPTFNPFDNVANYEGSADGLVPQFPPPANSVIMPFTLAFENWLLAQLLTDATLNIDAGRVSIAGHSAGGKGATIWARTSPNAFSHVAVFDPEVPYNFDFGVKVRMFGITTTPPAGAGPAMVTGSNFRVAGLTDSTGGAVHFDDLLDLRTDVSAQRDLPPMLFYYGLRENNWELDHDHTLKSDVQEMMEYADSLGTGAVIHWDMRDHGIGTWTLTPTYESWGFVAGDFWVPSVGAQTRRDDPDTLARFRSDQSYPAFYNLRARPGHNSPGVLNYGTVPPYFDNFGAWADPTPGDHFPATMTGAYDKRGTWGGYFDWIDDLPGNDPRDPRDEAGQWARSLFLPTTVDGGGNVLAVVDAAPVAALTCDIAVRRPQLFTPANGMQVTWMNIDQASRTVQQSGKVTVASDAVVRLPGITVPRAPLVARVIAATQMDFGDAPSGYPVTLSEEGARHATDAALSLGTARNVENDGAHHPLALSSAESDDGVTASALWQKESLVTLSITVSADCRLDAWVDWSHNSQWSDAGDRIASSLPLTAGVNTRTIFVPASAVEGTTFARFRVSLGGGLSSTGPAPDGEVEDYPLQITAATSPTLPALTITTNGLGQPVIRWQGNPAYSSQMEHSADLITWNTFALPAPETAGLNEVIIQSRFIGDPRHFFRLARRALNTSPIPLPAPGGEAAHRFIDQTFVHGGITRRYRLKLPNNWTPLRSWPLVMMLPGHSQSAEEFWDNRSEMFDLANGDDGDGDPNDGWILCFAEATSGDENFRWFPYNDPRPANSGVAIGYIDDYAFVKALTGSLLGSGLNVDPARVYAAGFSNGGNMAHYIASKADHPFAAFAMFDSGVQFAIHSGPEGTFIQADLPLPVLARPVLINNQLDSTAWPYEGWSVGYNFGAPSPGARACVARWATANGVVGAAADAVLHTYTTPAASITNVHNWNNTTGPTMNVPINDVRPDIDWPGALIGQNGWTVPLLSQLPLYIDPRTPADLRALFPHTIAPHPSSSGLCIVLNGRWTKETWIPSLPGSSAANEIVLITMSTGGHNWPEDDSPWVGHRELLEFFEAHPLPTP